MQDTFIVSEGHAIEIVPKVCKHSIIALLMVVFNQDRMISFMKTFCNPTMRFWLARSLSGVIIIRDIVLI